MTAIYTIRVDDAIEGSIAYPTLREAREAQRAFGVDGPISRIQIGKIPLRRLLCALYNREGFAAKQEEAP
jgi:hypothetical protein